MESAIRYQSSPGPEQRFLLVDVIGKSFKLCRITGQTKNVLEYDTVATHTRVPPFRAFDWSPNNESLVVVGQSSGEATLLKLDDASQDLLSFKVRTERLCNSVALSSENLLAAGLEKVRTDFCLNIWDIQQRLTSTQGRGFGSSKILADPLHKLAGSEPITSLKFFRDEPQTLVAGVKGQFVRFYDLREPSNSSGLQFATRCVHNIAIDGQDENYFASCYPTNDPEICIWDRRMIIRSTSAYSGFSSTNDTRQPEVSLELKKTIDTSGSIWSLRFSKTQRGCLGILSSTGHFKIFNIARDFVTDDERNERNQRYGVDWEEKYPRRMFLQRTLDIERPYPKKSAPQDNTARVVSFDFMATQEHLNQPNIIMLTGDGKIKTVSPEPVPEPAGFSSQGFFCKGDKEVKLLVTDKQAEATVGQMVNSIRRNAEPRSTSKTTFKQSKHSRVTPISSFANQGWNSDLGFFESDVPLSNLLTLTSIARLRCEAGYLFSPTVNHGIVSDSKWLQSMWTWIQRASHNSRSSGMTQDNLDLSYLGVHDLWLEEISTKTRDVGSRINSVARIIENISKRLNPSAGKMGNTLFPANRLMCLHVSGLAWDYDELDTLIKKYMSRGQFTRAAAMALFADEKRLAYRALRAKGVGQSHKMLAMAIAGTAKRRAKVGKGALISEEDTDTDVDADADWSESIASLSEELTDPYARAILAFVRTGDWNSVIQEESLPLRDRVLVALRWLDDSALTIYIKDITRQAVAAGDVEGILLTGTGTNIAVELMGNYLRRFGDLQTAVLALATGGAVMRFVSDATLLRRYDGWRGAYRHSINSWGMKFDRVRFDIGIQKLAVTADGSGRKLMEPIKPQIALVCGFCNQSIAQFDRVTANTDSVTAEALQRNPLMAEKAAAIGTVCPKCGRHLPRCGVCDHWLGAPDSSFMKWYGQNKGGTDGAVDLSASIMSTGTTIGPLPARSTQKTTRGIPGARRPLASVAVDAGGGAHVVRKESQDTTAVSTPTWEEMMARFTVFCTKCSHGFHAVHARDWFGGYAGRPGHKHEWQQEDKSDKRRRTRRTRRVSRRDEGIEKDEEAIEATAHPTFRSSRCGVIGLPARSVTALPSSLSCEVRRRRSARSIEASKHRSIEASKHRSIEASIDATSPCRFSKPRIRGHFLTRLGVMLRV